MTAMDDMNKRFRAKLRLSEKERLVVKIDKEELSDTLVACQYLLVARVLTNKSVNRDAFIEVFTTLRCGEQGVLIKEIGECRFVARFTSLRDKKRVLDMEPWNFSNSLVLLADVKRRDNFRTFDITCGVLGSIIWHSTTGYDRGCSNQDRRHHRAGSGCGSVEVT
ncbi:hypothetical protein ACE6H2_023572 [Prunus campanulata]